MGTINWIAISSIIVDLLILSVLISCTYWGHRKGLTAVIFKILIFIISIIAAFVLYKPITNFVIEKTQIDEWFNIRIEETLIGHEIVNGELINKDETNMSEAVVKFINSVAKDTINNAKENVVKAVAQKLSYFMVSTLTLIVIIIAVRVGLGLIKEIAQFIAKLPIINLVDKSGGIVYGFLKGLIIIYVILAIISIMSPLISELKVLNAINNSKLGSVMYNNNLLLNLIIK